MKNTSVVTRAVYSGESDALSRKGEAFEKGWTLTPERLQLMQDNYIPSLKSQRYKEFDIYILLGDADRPILDLDWGDLNLVPLYTKGRNINEFCRESLPRTRVQSRLDTDDRASPGWLHYPNWLADREEADTFLVHFEPLMEDRKGLLYYHPMYHNKQNKPSCFISLVQKGRKKMCIHQDWHTRMHKKVKKVFWLNPGYTFLSIHGENKSSSRHSRDKRV